MHVLMMIWNFWPGPEGGAERQCRRQARALVARGIECTVLTHWTVLSAPRTESDQGVTVRRVGLLGPLVHAILRRRRRAGARTGEAGPSQGLVEGGNASRHSLGWTLFRPLRTLDYLLFIVESGLLWTRLRKSVSVFHVHGACWMPGFARRLVGSSGVPVVSKETTAPALKPFDEDVPFRRRWEAHRRSAVFLAMHPRMVDDLRQAGVPDERIRLIPNGVALPPDAADVAMNRDVLFIGNFTQGAQTKAFDILIEAWALATRAVPDGALHVLGAGDNAPWLRLARERGCADRIFFQGFVKDPSALFRHAAVFALPSRIEGLSNALLEAQSWGVPAVVSDIPGNRFVVQNGESGFVAPVGDAAAFADALIRLLRDAPLRARMGRRAREIISRQFGIDRVASQLEDLYTELRAGARETLSG